jgi:hypothetical protein
MVRNFLDKNVFEVLQVDGSTVPDLMVGAGLNH